MILKKSTKQKSSYNEPQSNEQIEKKSNIIQEQSINICRFSNDKPIYSPTSSFLFADFCQLQNESCLQLNQIQLTMAEEEVLYGLATQKQLAKKMLAKQVSRSHDLSAQMLTELSDAIINGIQAYATFPNMPELATKSIKEVLDKRYGPAWHVVIGEGYAYDISVQSGAYLLMYYNGNLGCLVFKT